MTDSTISISPHTTSYRSQIHARIATPGSTAAIEPHTAVSRSRSVDQHLVSKDKFQLRKLNDQFLSYIERVRLCETYNHCLTVHSDQIRTAQDRTQTKLDSLKQEFDEYQQERCNREKKDIQLENTNTDGMEKQVDELKMKHNFFQHGHEVYRKQMLELQTRSVDLQGETEKLRFDYENLIDDNNHYRKQVSFYQSLKSSVLDEISRQRDINQRTQLEVEDLKMQKQINVQAHEADTQALQIQHDNILYDLTANFRSDGHGKHVLTEMLNEIREEYKAKDNEMRDELHRKYLSEYNHHIKKQLDQHAIEANREDLERRHLSNELNSLQDNRVLLRQKVTLVQEHYKQLELNVERELKRKKDTQDKYDEDIAQLRASVREYEHLLKDSGLLRSRTLEDEVNKYRQLLEGSDQQIGLRQLVNISNRNEHHRPYTPPPPPPPPRPPPPIAPTAEPSKSQSVATLLLLPSRTRQSSASEASYETAPASQSTITTTHQQYLTLNSINYPLIQHDYDTDNDQSQTIQYVSGRSSRLGSETDTTPTVLTPTNQESLPPFPAIDHVDPNETIIEIPIDSTSHSDAAINQTLPFIPMNIVTYIDLQTGDKITSDLQQSPLISTLEKRQDEIGKTSEPVVITPVESIIPITIEVNSNLVEEILTTKLISPLTPTMSATEPSKAIPSPNPTAKPSEGESSASGEAPPPALLSTNPLAKLMSSMLPDASPFVPTSNTINHPSVLPSPAVTSMMNNDAPSFIPTQNQHAAGQWGTRGGGSGGGTAGNRRGQSGGGAFHHGGGGNQRSGGGGNWQQGGSGQNKQRRGPK